MADQTTVLQLVLSRLHLGNSISSIDERIALQKVVCLAQEAGLQLGYSFNWYIRGPYSPSLASDYYQIAAAPEAVEGSAQNFTLTERSIAALDKVARVMTVPANVLLSKVLWLELLASIVFLAKRHRLSLDAVKIKIQTSKPNLHPFFDQAVERLNEAEFALE